MNIQKTLTLLSQPFKAFSTATFAVTNRCNAKCGFCSIWRQEPVKPIEVRDMELAIKKLYSLGIRYIQFTGGEPLIYQHLETAIESASNLGILSTVVTNGSLITEQRAQKLKKAYVEEVQISVDHHDGSIMENNRGIPKLKEKIENGIRYLKHYGIPVSASTTISRLLVPENDDFRKLLEYCQGVGFRGVYFCHPMKDMESTYTLGGDGSLVNYSEEEMTRILHHLRDLKREGYPIDNSIETLEVGLENLQGKRSKYPCLGGYKTFYVDWNLLLFRCMKKADLIGHLLELDLDQVRLKRTECDECLISCMREPSIYFYGIKSILPTMRLIRKPKYINMNLGDNSRIHQ